jgi:hypothetical protein
MLREGLVLLTTLLGVCSLSVNAQADDASKDDACPLQTEWIPQTPLDGPSPAIVIPASIGNTPIRAFVDTGMHRTVLTLELAKRAGFKLGKESRRKAIGGEVSIFELGTVDLTIAGTPLRLEAGAAMSFAAALSEHPELQFELIVGRDILKRCATEIYADRNLVRIVTPSAPPADAISVPISFPRTGADPFVPVELGPALESRANVDTGSQMQLTLDEALWSAMALQGIRETSAISAGFGGVIVERLAFLPQMSIGATRLEQVETRFNSNRAYPGSGTIGLGLLARFNSIIDMPGATLWLSPRQTPVATTIKSTSGVQVGQNDHSLKVLHVMLNSPAAAIGLKDGDRICKVDGQGIPDDYWRSPLRIWSRDKPGRVVALTLCDGREKRLTLQDFY